MSFLKGLAAQQPKKKDKCKKDAVISKTSTDGARETDFASARVSRRERERPREREIYTLIATKIKHKIYRERHRETEREREGEKEGQREREKERGEREIERDREREGRSTVASRTLHCRWQRERQRDIRTPFSSFLYNVDFVKKN